MEAPVSMINVRQTRPSENVPVRYINEGGGITTTFTPSGITWSQTPVPLTAMSRKLHTQYYNSNSPDSFVVFNEKTLKNDIVLCPNHAKKMDQKSINDIVAESIVKELEGIIIGKMLDNATYICGDESPIGNILQSFLNDGSLGTGCVTIDDVTKDCKYEPIIPTHYITNELGVAILSKHVSYKSVGNKSENLSRLQLCGCIGLTQVMYSPHVSENVILAIHGIEGMKTKWLHHDQNNPNLDQENKSKPVVELPHADIPYYFCPYIMFEYLREKTSNNYDIMMRYADLLSGKGFMYKIKL